MRISVVVLACVLSSVNIFAEVPDLYKDKEDLKHYAKLMSMRCVFELSGAVVDEDGVPLDGVALTVTRSQFHLATQRTTTSNVTVTADRSFDFSFADLTSVALKAAKEGYQTASASFKYIDYSQKRTADIRRAAARGEVEKPQTFEETYSLYNDLVCKETNIVLVLRRLRGSPVPLVTGRVRFKLNETKRSETLQVYGPDNGGSAISLTLEISDDGHVADHPRLLLSSADGGGLILVEPGIAIHEMVEAPPSGYVPQVDLSHIYKKRPRSFSFWLKSKDGWFGKGAVPEGSGFYFSPQRRTASFILPHFAVQPSGSRIIETVDSK